MITEIIEFAGFDGHLVPICISARNSRLDGDGCFDSPNWNLSISFSYEDSF